MFGLAMVSDSTRTLRRRLFDLHEVHHLCTRPSRNRCPWHERTPRRCATSSTREGSRMRSTTRLVAAGAALILGIAGVATATFWDFGQHTQGELAHHANQLFGVKKPIQASSTVHLTEAAPLADPAALVPVAKGLKVDVVSAGNAAPNLDQMVLWPQSHPTHII